VLDVTDLVKNYGGFEFGPLDLSVGEEVLAVLGPSGSGKSTFLSLIAGIVPPDEGSITLDGRALVGRPVEERQTGLVFQDGALFPHMTARQNIAYAAGEGAHIDELADVLEISEVLDRRPPTLSGGEQQRVALARTLASDPDALLLDEPLSSLDVPIRRRLRGELHDLFASLDIPVVYVTHDQRTATALGDRIAIFRDGVVEQVGTPEDILMRPQNRFVARFTGNENLFEAEVLERDGDGILLEVGNATLRSGESAPPDSSVTACIHPSRIQLHDTVGTVAENGLSGTVERWLNEGNDYRIVVTVDGTPLSLTATVRPPTFDRLAPVAGTAIRVSVPSEAIHLIEESTRSPKREHDVG
jgi:molybdate/tungstate transport system ATP-binding protein